MMLRTTGIIGLGILAAIAIVTVVTNPSENPGPMARPNVLVIVWDTVRADRMSLYGHSVPTTPRLDERARTAVVFERATAPAMWTLPTHASMFTGQFATTHGAVASYRWLDHHHETLAERLSAAGYDTFAFTSNLVASPLTNVLQGFATVHTTYPRKGEPGRYTKASRRATRDKLLPDDASTEISPAFEGDDRERWARSVHKDAAPVIHRGLADWLDERVQIDRPWFAYLNLMEAHSPRVPSAEAREHTMDAATRAPALTVDQSLLAANAWIVGARKYSDADLDAIAGVYDATLHDLDRATDALLDDLDRRGELDDTLVVLLSDHGEHLGEHRRLEHRWSLRQPLVHVPLVVWSPDRAGERVARRVSTAGLFATVLEAAGLPVPHTAQAPSWFAKPQDARVYAQLLDPFVSQLEKVHEVYPHGDYAPLAETFCAAFDGDYKLLVGSTGHRSLHDLSRDPGELVDLAATLPARAAGREGALARWQDRLPDHDATLRTARDLRGASRQDATEQRMLAALGYTAEDGAAPLTLRCEIPR